MGERDQV
jgi:hypothetical protein